MERQGIVVIDIGKSVAKVSLWDGRGAPVARHSRSNGVNATSGYRALDVDGIDAWLADTLRAFATRAPIGAIVPVGHGAAAALIADGRLLLAPMDYEDEAPPHLLAAYRSERDPFQASGSPPLPAGLNLGMQLLRLDALGGAQGQILTWPQFWAWRLCGVAATEITSLGCHTDLWRPAEGRPSELAERHGWAARLAPMRRAATILGPVTSEWCGRCGLDPATVVVCGLHDSNAALLAARAHPEMAGDATILSTGTWFVAMRSLAAGAAFDLASLPETRDCLVNVDVEGRLVPSARFMGGREAETMMGGDTRALTESESSQDLLERLPRLLAEDVMALPSFVTGTGPFPASSARWSTEPHDARDRQAAAGLYLALMAHAALDLIGSTDCLLIEGRFAAAELFVRSLAALRPDQRVYVSNARDDVPYGALRLLRPQLPPREPLERVLPLSLDLSAYAARWRAAAESREGIN